MDTRHHPAPPRRTTACSRTGEPGVVVTRLHRWRSLGTVLFVAFVAGTGATGADASELEHRIAESLALCAAADELAPDARLPVLARGLALADSALGLDDRSARAHFAVVCNLGKATGLGAIGFGTLGAVYRLQREVDLTLTLAPNDAEALAAKGALLMRLPRWLGGDRTAAARWLRRALAVDPGNATARSYLDEVEAEGGFVAPAANTTRRR